MNTNSQGRAWFTIGISIRHAQAAGLHLRHKDPALSAERKAGLSRTWRALHSIETTLSAITGRPRVINLKDITVVPTDALPPFEKQSCASTDDPQRLLMRTDNGPTEALRPSSHGRGEDSTLSFQNAYIGIDIIMHKVLATLYSSSNTTISWKQMQKEIESLLAELEEWALQALPHGLLASTALTDVREHFLLYVYYSSTKMYITRPCLSRIDTRGKGKNEESAGFSKKTAEACVQAALDLSSKFPEHANPRWLYEKGPWWASVHISESIDYCSPAIVTDPA